MTDQERDPAATGPADADLEAEARAAAIDGGDAVTDADDLDAEFDVGEDDEGEDEDGEPAAADEDVAGTLGAAGSGAAVAGAAGTVGRRRLRDTPTGRAVPVAPTVAEEAVKVQDRASQLFVIGMVGVFVLLFAYALLLGHGGLLSGAFATPRPSVAPIESVAPSVAPGASAAASASAGASSAPSASAGASAPASAAPSTAPSPAAASASPASS